MTFFVSLCRGALLLLIGVWLSGCLPSAQSQADEEREPQFLAGKSRVSSMDFKGAIESFEKALEANPRSAAAHFELAWLFDQKEHDPAAAIYHYSRYLKLRPSAENADTVRTRIMACKQELVRSEANVPITPTMQRELEQLLEEKRQLKEEIEKWRAYATHLQAALTNSATVSQARAAAPPSPTPSVVNIPRAEPAPAVVETSSASSAGTAPRVIAPSPVRTHTVKAGDTPAAIAKRYGVRLESLMSANPRIDARRLKIGQVLTIPPS